MESMINTNKVDIGLLKKLDIGALGYFEFSPSVARISFLNSLTSIIVTPILHENMNKFMGISPLTEYICYNVIRDQFSALNKNGLLTTWNLLTGKFMHEA